MQHVYYTLPYPNRDASGSYGSNRGSTRAVADVQSPHIFALLSSHSE